MYRVVCLSLLFALAIGSAFGQVRTWRDATGKFSIEAEFVEFQDGKVRLRKSDGKTISIPKDRLSKQDQSYVDAVEERAGKPRSDGKWRQDYNAFVEAIKVTQKDGKPVIDWGDAQEFGKWYDLAAESGRIGVRMIDRRFRTPEKINEWKALTKKIEAAQKALDGIEWTAKTIFVKQSPSASTTLDLRPLPKPLKIVFWVAEKDVPNWANVKNGDTIRFTCTFDILTGGDFPQINARMTLKR